MIQIRKRLVYTAIKYREFMNHLLGLIDLNATREEMRAFIIREIDEFEKTWNEAQEGV